MKCTNCLKEIYPKDEDAGTYKERYCSEKCQSEIEDLIDNIIDGDEKPSDLMQLLDALKGLYKLVEDGDLVRDSSKDDDISYYIQQGLRITMALKKVQLLINESI